ncbi:MAG: AAA family ATPase [archaeon]
MTLMYEDIQLGERLTQQYLKKQPLDVGHPTYLNTRPFFANLNVTDAVMAAVLGKLNILLVGDTGKGKTQLASDIYNYLFNGNMKEQGSGVWMKGRPDLEVYTEIFTEINIDKARRDLTEKIEAMIYVVDELNRCPSATQNQFFGMGDGTMDYNGRTISLGRDGYAICIGTANIGNGEFKGTFDTDKALYGRMHVAFDFDHNNFKPTREDSMIIDALHEADPRVKQSKKRDQTADVLAAYAAIKELAAHPSLEMLAAINYIRFGLDNCRKEAGAKEKNWPGACQDCDHNKDGRALCSYINTPVIRTTKAIRLYSAALQFVAELKDPKVEMDTTDLVFKVFEVTGAYQELLNPLLLRQNFNGHNPKMMKEVVEKLKVDYMSVKDYILAALYEAQQGNRVTRFFKKGDTLGSYDDLSDEKKPSFTKEEPFTDATKTGIGMQWVVDQVELIIKAR